MEEGAAGTCGVEDGEESYTVLFSGHHSPYTHGLTEAMVVCCSNPAQDRSAFQQAALIDSVGCFFFSF